MRVSCIEQFAKGKFKISLDGDVAFWLYASEVKAYFIAWDAELENCTVEEILKETVIPRAKKKAMDLLIHQDRTEQELRQRLRQSGFGEITVNAAISYVKDFNYLDDSRYIDNLISSKKGYKSKFEISLILQRKGIDRASANIRLEAVYADNEEENFECAAIRAMIEKKIKDPDSATIEGKRKLYAALARKGYAYDLIAAEFNRIFGLGDILLENQ